MSDLQQQLTQAKSGGSVMDDLREKTVEVVLLQMQLDVLQGDMTAIEEFLSVIVKHEGVRHLLHGYCQEKA